MIDQASGIVISNVSVPPSALIIGDNWSCSAFINDSVLTDGWDNSSNYTVQDGIVLNNLTIFQRRFVIMPQP